MSNRTISQDLRIKIHFASFCYMWVMIAYQYYIDTEGKGR